MWHSNILDQYFLKVHLLEFYDLKELNEALSLILISRQRLVEGEAATPYLNSREHPSSISKHREPYLITWPGKTYSLSSYIKKLIPNLFPNQTGCLWPILIHGSLTAVSEISWGLSGKNYCKKRVPEIHPYICYQNWGGADAPSPSDLQTYALRQGIGFPMYQDKVNVFLVL